MNQAPTITGLTGPRGMVFVSDDALAINIINEVNMLNCLPKRQDCVNTRVWFTYQGYFIMAQYDYDHPSPIDNGYSLLCLPCSQWSINEATNFFANFVEEDCRSAGGNPSIHLHEGSTPRQPIRNQ